MYCKMNSKSAVSVSNAQISVLAMVQISHQDRLGHLVLGAGWAESLPAFATFWVHLLCDWPQRDCLAATGSHEEKNILS